MKYLFLVMICMGIATTGNAQKKGAVLQTGIYSGGICVDGGICGEWVIKADSTFAFVEFNNQMLKQIGQGRIVKKTNDRITFVFDNSRQALLPIKTTYSTATVASYDSVYIQGTLNDIDGKPVAHASVVYNNRYTSLSDKDGHFYKAFHKRESITQLQVIKQIEGYQAVTFMLMPFNNSHTFTVQMSKTANTSGTIIEPTAKGNKGYTFRLHKLKNGPAPALSLIYITNNTTNLINRLLAAKQSQPLLSTNIGDLVNLINQ